MRLHVLTLIALLCSAPGCFVAEELDQSSAWMEQHSAPEESAPVATAPPPAGLGERASAVWDTVRSWALPGQSTPAPDPFVHCQLANGTRFTSELDCLAQNGRVLL